MTDWAIIAERIGAATGRPFAPNAAPRPVGGGCINEAVSLRDGERR